jgi:hypothetical protein
MINQLLLTNGQFIRVGKPFPNAQIVDQEGKEHSDSELVRIIIERPASQSDDGDEETPAHFECWVLPELFVDAIGQHLMFEQVVRARKRQLSETGSTTVPQPSDNVIKTLADNQHVLETSCPKVTCHKVQACNVIDASERVSIKEAWVAISEHLAADYGIEEDAPDEGDGDDENPQSEAAVVHGGA